MSERFTEEEVIARVSSLTRPLLVSFVRAEVVRPLLTESGPLYRRIDVARLELLCELGDVFELHDDALRVVIQLIDQLHTARHELRVVLDAISQEASEDLRRRIGQALVQADQG